MDISILESKSEHVVEEAVEPVTISSDPFPPQFDIEHPAIRAGMDSVIVDHARVLCPDAIVRGLGNSPIGFRIGQQTYPAVFANRRGKQGTFVDILCQFNSQIVKGSIVNVGQSNAPPHWSPGNHGLINPTATSSGWTLASNTVDTVRSTSLLMIRRFVWAHENSRIAILETRTALGSPVSRCTLVFSRRKNDLYLSVADLEIDFGNDSIIHQSPCHARRDFSHIAGSKIHFLLNVGQCTFPSTDFTVVHGSAQNYLDDQVIFIAKYDGPVGRFNYLDQEYSDCKFMALHKAPNCRQSHTDQLAGLIKDRYPHLTGRSFIGGSVPYEPRFMDQNFISSNAGTQRFGVVFSPGILTMTPYESYCFALDSASGEQLRPHVWMTDYGNPITHLDTPEIKCVNRRPYLPHSNKNQVNLIFDGGVVSPCPETGRSSEDPQHTDDLAIHAALALWDRYELEIVARQIVERDLAENRNYSGWVAGTRGEGRPWLSNSNAAWLFKGDNTGLAADIFLRVNHAIMMNVWYGGRAIARGNTGVLSVTVLLDPRLDVFDSTGKKLYAYMPYEHGTVIAACLAAANALEDDVELSRKFLTLGAALGSSFFKLLPMTTEGQPQVQYVQGVPGNPDDPADMTFGKLPPVQALTVGTQQYFDWNNQGGSWNHWSVRAAYAFPKIVQRLGISGMFAAELDKAQKLIRIVEQELNGEHLTFRVDEYYRMSTL